MMKSHPGLGFVFAKFPECNKVWDIFLCVAFSFSWGEHSGWIFFPQRLDVFGIFYPAPPTKTYVSIAE